MSFTYHKLDDGNYEVLMAADTVASGKPRSKERRFALCAHENDALTIAVALNRAEAEGWLRV